MKHLPRTLYRDMAVAVLKEKRGGKKVSEKSSRERYGEEILQNDPIMPSLLLFFFFLWEV